jgi:hypothetical protein
LNCFSSHTLSFVCSFLPSLISPDEFTTISSPCFWPFDFLNRHLLDSVTPAFVRRSITSRKTEQKRKKKQESSHLKTHGWFACRRWREYVQLRNGSRVKKERTGQTNTHTHRVFVPFFSRKQKWRLRASVEHDTRTSREYFSLVCAWPRFRSLSCLPF